MNTNMQMDDELKAAGDNPGAQLAQLREKKGYSREYVAGKLHLRVRLIELLETDSYDQMPEPVFVKGYFRAYAKLLEVSPDPFLALFNSLYSVERKSEKTLWQGKRETYRREKVARWVTVCVVIVAIVTVGVWWHNNTDATLFLSDPKAKPTSVTAEKSDKKAPDQLSEVSKMQSLFQFSSEPSIVEKKIG